MIWLLLPILIALSALAFFVGSRLATGRARAAGVKAHSRPAQHGLYAMIWVGVPALAILILAGIFSGPIAYQSLAAGASPAVNELETFKREAFFDDARRVGQGQIPQQIWLAPLAEELVVEGRRAAALHNTLTAGAAIAALIAAVLGALFVALQIKPGLRARNRVEGWIGGILFCCSAVAILTTVGIVFSLVFDSLRFFQSVPVTEFLFGIKWSPQIAIRADQVGSSGAFGAVPLFAGTFLIMIIAMCVAAPVGLFSAIYLSEYASWTSRAVVKPVLEVLAGIPTIVYGFFALVTVGPFLRDVSADINNLFTGNYVSFIQGQSVLTAGIVMGIMLIPFVSSLSDDIITAVPGALRDGSLGLGATRSETVKRVILPAALPGIVGALLLTASRAVGETMIVVLAAGVAARMQLNPFEPMTTVTVKIVHQLTGDLEFTSPQTLVAFALGITLFVITLCLNIYALYIVRKYREQYE